MPLCGKLGRQYQLQLTLNASTLKVLLDGFKTLVLQLAADLVDRRALGCERKGALNCSCQIEAPRKG